MKQRLGPMLALVLAAGVARGADLSGAWRADHATQPPAAAEPVPPALSPAIGSWKPPTTPGDLGDPTAAAVVIIRLPEPSGIRLATVAALCLGFYGLTTRGQTLAETLGPRLGWLRGRLPRP
jgi:hypothetical protein